MFKKSKPQIAPPPAPPTVEDMLADIETFELSQPAGSNNIVNNSAFEDALLTEPENLSLETWWQVFDEYDRKVKKLESMEETLVTQKDKLLACKLKLEIAAKDLRDGINKQQSLIKEVIDC